MRYGFLLVLVLYQPSPKRGAIANMQELISHLGCALLPASQQKRKRPVIVILDNALLRCKS